MLKLKDLDIITTRTVVLTAQLYSDFARKMKRKTQCFILVYLYTDENKLIFHSKISEKILPPGSKFPAPRVSSRVYFLFYTSIRVDARDFTQAYTCMPNMQVYCNLQKANI